MTRFDFACRDERALPCFHRKAFAVIEKRSIFRVGTEVRIVGSRAWQNMYIAQAKSGRFEIAKELGVLDPQEPLVKGERTSAKRG